jgi:nucleoid DNA-binding protein
METSRRVTMAEFVKEISTPGYGISEATAKQVLSQAATSLARLMAHGCAVTIDGIGTFKATVGVSEDKERDAFAENEPQRNAQSIEVNGVHYRADKALVKAVRSQCTLERGKQSRIKHSPYTLEERISRAIAFIKDHGYMRTRDYAELNELSLSTATVELRKVRKEEASGIKAIGRGSSLVYVRR